MAKRSTLQEQTAKVTEDEPQTVDQAQEAADTEFSFQVEEGIPIPEGGTGGKTKYQWEKLEKVGQSVFITGITSPKTLYSSTNKYVERLKKEGVKEEDLPKFTVRKAEENTVKGFRVWRSK